MNRKMLDQFKLGKYVDILSAMEREAFTFRLQNRDLKIASNSKLGGEPLLPEGFSWPHSNTRELDFLLQIDLSEIAQLNSSSLLPKSGVLSFFYDIENQPWGFDPTQLDGFKVEYFAESSLRSRKSPQGTLKIPEFGLSFMQIMTMPDPSNWTITNLQNKGLWTEADRENYFDFLDVYNSQIHLRKCPNHWLLGHSTNVQGDMQLEAQLVSNGCYCGDATGYNDPRRKTLESGAEDWQLLLQLDSDESAELMWGDCGLLYFWIRNDDLANCRFSQTWMSLQCC